LTGRCATHRAYACAATSADAAPMALRRALEMLKAGERINDELYRSTVDGPRRSPLLVWVYEPGFAPVSARLAGRVWAASPQPRLRPLASA
jgi:hypothetical protein